MYIDSHCHITCDDLYNRKEEVIQNMQELSGAMIMCTNQKEFLRALPIKEKDARFKIAWGWFPGDAKEISENHYRQQLMPIRLTVSAKSVWIIIGMILSKTPKKKYLFAK